MMPLIDFLIFCRFFADAAAAAYSLITLLHVAAAADFVIFVLPFYATLLMLMPYCC